MDTTNSGVRKQLTITVENGELVISIGIALLAFAVQAPSSGLWPEDWYVAEVDAFAKEIVRELDREEEDGTTPVHRLLDAAAEAVLENGGDGIEEGSVLKGIRIAERYLEAKS